MPELFHPDLPGVSSELSEGWRRSGWLPWDELTDEQQAAHNAAVAANLKEAAQSAAQGSEAAFNALRTAVAGASPEGVDWEALTIPELRTYAEQRGIDLGDVKKKPDIVAAIEAAEQQNTESAPNVGDTTKE